MGRGIANIGLSWKVQLAPALLAIALIGIGVYALQALRTNQQSVDALVSGPVRSSELAADLNNAAWTAHAKLYRLAATAANETDEAKLAQVSKEAIAAIARIPQALADVEKSLGGDSAIQKLKAAVAGYQKQAKNAIEMADGDAGSALLFIKSAEKSFTEIDALISDLIVSSNDARDRQIAQAGIALDRQQWMLGAVLAVISLIGIAVSFLIGRGIARPVVAMSGAMHELASGNFDVRLPGLERGDEVGRMARAVEAFKVQAASKAEREHAEREALERTAAAARRAELHQLADGFETAVGQIIEAVGAASRELEESADALAKGSAVTLQLSNVVATASTETSNNVQSVASAAEQMNASVGEVGRQVRESRSIAAEAVTQAEQTDARIAKLAQAATRIGDVTQLITTIAAQTNLLALNATIEAARAGEAGRGFAVVAQEVKALAEQTSKATGEISAQIAEIQSATRESVVAIKEIGGTIGRVAHIASAVAASVDEQGTATQEISRSVSQAAVGTNQVASSIADVNRGAADAGAASSRVLTSAQLLSNENGRLRVEVQKFLATVRVA
ncbi:methyl-accepting chemotaxis sensory transducer [Rhodopseudomonas palustris HaA2]|uniref:Methyl-accepting chemotaxis sensory transducer n=1 Tax=Rhodopseudomonas palustris (strain HaA2) TaxID=316058 RepID=Q2IZD6_RHOP2|nr:methyl-accepting chemotaxis protein [Rhodopseudomonas palustris]ABD06424.1 methyl-accepting chemotaxis sensory transducer [Rhodopseudomonas palustris HaA2]